MRLRLSQLGERRARQTRRNTGGEEKRANGEDARSPPAQRRQEKGKEGKKQGERERERETRCDVGSNFAAEQGRGKRQQDKKEKKNSKKDGKGARMQCEEKKTK